MKVKGGIIYETKRRPQNVLQNAATEIAREGKRSGPLTSVACFVIIFCR